jgi:L-lysine exporter family protein LysE/ArgO
MSASFPISPAIEGFLLGGGLIVAIGAQNAFVLRQGLLRSHVFILCLICALSDALLVAVGVAGLGTFIEQNDALLKPVAIAGSLFLFAYAIIAARRAIRPHGLDVGSQKAPTLKVALATVLAFTFLNPHVYLDTVVLVGSLSARFAGIERLAFGAGAVIASFVWFFALGYGARWLAPIFALPIAWRVLDAIIAVVMTLLGLSLIRQFFV